MVCVLCNQLKSDFLPDEFVYFLACRIRWSEPIVGKLNYDIDLLQTVYKNVRSLIGNRPVTVTTTRVKRPRQVSPIGITISEINKTAKINKREFITYKDEKCYLVGFLKDSIGYGTSAGLAVYKSGCDKLVVNAVGGYISYYINTIAGNVEYIGNIELKTA